MYLKIIQLIKNAIHKPFPCPVTLIKQVVGVCWQIKKSTHLTKKNSLSLAIMKIEQCILFCDGNCKIKCAVS